MRLIWLELKQWLKSRLRLRPTITPDPPSPTKAAMTGQSIGDLPQPDRLINSFTTVQKIRENFYRSCTAITGYLDINQMNQQKPFFRIEAPLWFESDLLRRTDIYAICQHSTRVSREQMESVCQTLDALGLWKWPELPTNTRTCVISIHSFSSCSPYEQKNDVIRNCSRATFEHVLVSMKKVVPELELPKPLFDHIRRL
ncbi:hypothetical protein [Desulfobacca acetoxidans]|uniref:Uncharacterized protein n=1 Tax=Desulfobacca acetoxidans (strain ATCC 700848 / DSM 11109 / ASRB2) TaxID=880072 RepID=F2NIR2_DESAR|nr:hypothetical protein [Desulfobacca acetoxidans]AEB10537.1 hypothetical protein Desac_2723 [Desulfobacca acetoxidans DSM 11109]